MKDCSDHDRRPRVRFAPSPTGSLHVGGARTALFNWLFARRHGGSLVLRIEDTDLGRSDPALEEAICDDLLWLGLSWDEGPRVGGPFAPYRQTDRLQVYRQTASRLTEAGLTYPCYCLPEELEARRQASLARGEPPRYDGGCSRLTAAQRRQREEQGRLPALRFQVPSGPMVVDDLIRGRVEFPPEEFGDFVLMKSNGTPSYNFAVVVDDSAMGITHVIRGDEHLVNTPRQLMLYRALGLTPPHFAHLSMILSAGDRQKLSKRHGTTSLNEFREAGYLPAAMANFLCLLGWSPGDDQEKFTLEEMVQVFSLERVALSPAVFDRAKLDWFNAHYLRSLPPDQLGLLGAPFLTRAGCPEEASRQQQVASLFVEQIHTLADLDHLYREYFSEEIGWDSDARELLTTPAAGEVVRVLADELEQLVILEPEGFKPLIDRIKEKSGRKGKELFMPIRAAVTGRLHGPELARLLPLLGRDLLRKRISLVPVTPVA